ncbi:MAG: electron transfer flavoprotein subunit beta, partial [Lawsonibacter sp.]
AERLGLPQVTYVKKLTVEEGGRLIVERQLEYGHEVLEVHTPALLSAVKELNTPRYMSILGICRAYEKEISTLSIQDLDITPEETGLKASPTKVYRTFTPETGRAGLLWEEDAGQMADHLMAALREKHVV